MSDLDKIINQDEAKKAGDKLTAKIKDGFKKFINSIRIPRLVDVFVKNPDSFQSALKDAPEAKNNWVRLGLEKTWPVFVPLIIVIGLYFLQVAAKFIAIAVLLFAGVYIIRKVIKS